VIRGASIGAVALTLSCLTGCAHDFVQLEVDEPAGAHATIEQGFATPEIDTTAPFVGSFETVSLSDADAWHVKFDLDAKAAARIGAGAPTTIYGLLVVGPPTALAKTQTLVLRMPEEKLRALVRGERSEIEVFVEDPNEDARELARLVLRMRPI
jgi:hypothetical protein